MSREIHVKGMVLQSAPYAEYDRRVVLLTKELGKITAFARGARRPTSVLLAASGTFHFGDFTLYEGRSAYTLGGAHITNYFRKVRENLENSFYGAYFAELAAYYGRENLEAGEMLNLLYAALRALENEVMPRPLIRCAYEIRMMVMNGEYPQQAAEDENLLPAVRYTMQYIFTAPLGKLFSFALKDEVFEQLVKIHDPICRRTIDARMKSLEILETIG